MASNSDIAHGWAHGRGPSGGDDGLYHRHGKVFSFGEHWMLGFNSGSTYFMAEYYDGGIHGGSAGYTNKHYSKCRSAIPHGSEVIDDVPQNILWALSMLWSEEFNWERFSNAIVRCAERDMMKVKDILYQTAFMKSYWDYHNFPREIWVLTWTKLAVVNSVFVRSKATEDQVMKLANRVLASSVIDYQYDEPNPYAHNVLRALLEKAVQDVFVNRYGSPITAPIDGFEQLHPVFSIKREKLKDSFHARSDAMRGAARVMTPRHYGSKKESDWEMWYRYEKRFSTCNDAEGFTRLRLMKSSKKKIQSSLGVTISRDTARMVLIAYDRGIDELPAVESSAGTFGASRIHRNGSDETSYVVYGCHKVRIAEARKVLS